MNLMRKTKNDIFTFFTNPIWIDKIDLFKRFFYRHMLVSSMFIHINFFFHFLWIQWYHTILCKLVLLLLYHHEKLKVAKNFAIYQKSKYKVTQI